MLLESIEAGEMVSVVGRAWEQAGPLTRSQEVAVRRAARRLHEDGKARVFYRQLPIAGGGRCTPQLVIASVESDHQGDIRPLNTPEWMWRSEMAPEQLLSIDRSRALRAQGVSIEEIAELQRGPWEAFAERGDRAIAEQAASAEPEPGR